MLPLITSNPRVCSNPFFYILIATLLQRDMFHRQASAVLQFSSFLWLSVLWKYVRELWSHLYHCEAFDRFPGRLKWLVTEDTDEDERTSERHAMTVEESAQRQWHLQVVERWNFHTVIFTQSPRASERCPPSSERRHSELWHVTFKEMPENIEHRKRPIIIN